MVAMATAVSRDRPDLRLPRHGGAHRRRRPPRVPAPHRARPRDRDPRGLDALRQAVGDAPGRAAQHGHLAGRHLRGGAPRARVRTTPDGALRGGLGGLSAGPSSSATSSKRPSSRGRAAERRLTETPDADTTEDVARDARPSAGAACRRSAVATCAHPDATCGPTRRALWDRMPLSWAGLDDAAWHLPGAAPSDAGGPAWSLAEHVGHIADWLELAAEYTTRAIETGEWPSDDDYGDFDTFNEGRREPWASMPRDAILGRLEAARPRSPRGRAAALPRGRSAATTGGAGCTRRSTATISTISRSSSRGPPNCVVPAPLADADRTDHAVAQPDDRGDRRGRHAARVPAPPARPRRRVHGRGRRSAAAVHADVARRLSGPAHRLGEARLGPALVARRASPRLRPRRRDLGRSKRTGRA